MGQWDSLPLTSTHPPFLNPNHCCIWELHSHLDRPQKSRASGKEGMFKIEGLCGTELPAPICHSQYRRFPIWFSWLQMGSLPCGLVTCCYRVSVTPRKQGFREITCKCPIWNLAPVFCFHLFSSTKICMWFKNRSILASCLLCSETEEFICLISL